MCDAARNGIELPKSTIMKISEIMTKGVQTVTPGTSAAQARDRMRTNRIHHLLVKEGTELVGLLSARDLARGARRTSVTKRVMVTDLMTPRVVIVRPDTSVRRAADLMRGRAIGSLIVVDRGRAVGIVHRRRSARSD